MSTAFLPTANRYLAEASVRSAFTRTTLPPLLALTKKVSDSVAVPEQGLPWHVNWTWSDGPARTKWLDPTRMRGCCLATEVVVVTPVVVVVEGAVVVVEELVVVVEVAAADEPTTKHSSSGSDSVASE